METSEDEELMLHGHCHLFAVAVHEMTGMPLCAWLDEDPVLGEGTSVLVHAAVLVDDDTVLDVRGPIRIEAALSDVFDTFDPDLVSISIQDLLELGQGTRSIDNGHPDMVRARRVAAQAVARMGLPAAGPRR